VQFLRKCWSDVIRVEVLEGSKIARPSASDWGFCAKMVMLHRLIMRLGFAHGIKFRLDLSILGREPR